MTNCPASSLLQNMHVLVIRSAPKTTWDLGQKSISSTSKRCPYCLKHSINSPVSHMDHPCSPYMQSHMPRHATALSSQLHGPDVLYCVIRRPVSPASRPGSRVAATHPQKAKTRMEKKEEKPCFCPCASQQLLHWFLELSSASCRAMDSTVKSGTAETGTVNPPNLGERHSLPR